LPPPLGISRTSRPLEYVDPYSYSAASSLLTRHPLEQVQAFKNCIDTKTKSPVTPTPKPACRTLLMHM
jgi:hypothetical protein